MGTPRSRAKWMRSQYAGLSPSSPSGPKSADREAPDDTKQPVHVVGMGMRQKHQIELGDSARTQHRLDDTRSGVEAVVVVASTVDQSDESSGSLNERRISLANVDEGHAQIVAGSSHDIAARTGRRMRTARPRRLQANQRLRWFPPTVNARRRQAAPQTSSRVSHQFGNWTKTTGAPRRKISASSSATREARPAASNGSAPNHGRANASSEPTSPHGSTTSSTMGTKARLPTGAAGVISPK